ncbi:MAG: hypothetical protein AAFQ29_12035 [Pseudomonadota bacterium]
MTTRTNNDPNRITFFDKSKNRPETTIDSPQLCEAVAEFTRLNRQYRDELGKRMDAQDRGYEFEGTRDIEEITHAALERLFASPAQTINDWRIKLDVYGYLLREEYHEMVCCKKAHLRWFEHIAREGIEISQGEKLIMPPLRFLDVWNTPLTGE